MAANLARSFLWWHPESDIQFQIVTDQINAVPDDIINQISIIYIKPGELGEGFSPKLHLDKLASDGQTLFIDSDCLIYGKLDPVFKVFKGHRVSVIGNYISEGEWFGNIGDICKQFNIPHMPKFNGGIYYIERGDEATRVYNAARELETQYDQIGFIRLRDRPNDEVLMSLAMELNQQVPIAEDGNILGELLNFRTGARSDLLNGLAELYNDPSNSAYNKNWPLTIGRPVIVHFLGHHNLLMPYIKEAKQLKYLFVNNLPINAARLITFIQVTLPFTIVLNLKNIFRSAYRAVFGVRKIKKSERVIDL